MQILLFIATKRREIRVMHSYEGGAHWPMTAKLCQYSAIVIEELIAISIWHALPTRLQPGIPVTIRLKLLLPKGIVSLPGHETRAAMPLVFIAK